MEVIPWILAVTDCISTCESCRDYNGCCGSNRSVSTSLVPMELRVWSLKQASRGSGERTLSIILCSVSLSKRGPRTKQSPAARQLWRWSCGFTSTWIRLDIIPAKRKKKTCYRLLSQLPLWEYFFVLLFVCLVNRTPTFILCPLKKNGF